MGFRLNVLPICVTFLLSIFLSQIPSTLSKGPSYSCSQQTGFVASKASPKCTINGTEQETDARKQCSSLSYYYSIQGFLMIDQAKEAAFNPNFQVSVCEKRKICSPGKGSTASAKCQISILALGYDVFHEFTSGEPTNTQEEIEKLVIQNATEWEFDELEPIHVVGPQKGWAEIVNAGRKPNMAFRFVQKKKVHELLCGSLVLALLNKATGDLLSIEYANIEVVRNRYLRYKLPCLNQDVKMGDPIQEELIANIGCTKGSSRSYVKLEIKMVTALMHVEFHWSGNSRCYKNGKTQTTCPMADGPYKGGSDYKETLKKKGIMDGLAPKGISDVFIQEQP